MSDHPTRPKPLEQMGEVELNEYLISLGGSTDGSATTSGTYLRSIIVDRIVVLENALAAQRAAEASVKSARWASIAGISAGIAAIFAALAWLVPKG